MSTPLDNLQKIDHIVVLMMENRSFDHMLGFLSLDQGRDDVNGLHSGLINQADGKNFAVHQATSTKLVKAQDPCHSGWCVDEQVAAGMAGFAANYKKTRKQHFKGDTPGTVMAYHTAKQLPVYAYLADQYCVCDRTAASTTMSSPRRQKTTIKRSDATGRASPRSSCRPG
jgi:phospholipase C